MQFKLRISLVRRFYFLLVHCMKFLCKIRIEILISTKTLFYISTSYIVPVRNKIIPQSKFVKKCYFVVPLILKLGSSKFYIHKNFPFVNTVSIPLVRTSLQCGLFFLVRYEKFATMRISKKFRTPVNFIPHNKKRLVQAVTL